MKDIIIVDTPNIIATIPKIKIIVSPFVKYLKEKDKLFISSFLWNKNL